MEWSSGSLAGSKEDSTLILSTFHPLTKGIIGVYRRLSSWSVYGHPLKHWCFLMATADDPLFILAPPFLPARAKCYKVLGPINLPPGKLQNIPSVFAPGMGRTVNTKGHTPTVHDKMLPTLCKWRACFGKLTRLHVLLSLFQYYSSVSPSTCVKVTAVGHKCLASFLYVKGALAAERSEDGQEMGGWDILGATVQKSTVKSPLPNSHPSFP